MMAQLPGPLVVSKANPRYFAAPAAAGGPEKLIYLTGSHVNNNLHDGLGPGRECPEDPERFDFNAYLGLLSERGHDFVRLWRWEQFRGHLAPADVHFCMTPQPFMIFRTSCTRLRTSRLGRLQIQLSYRTGSRSRHRSVTPRSGSTG